MIYVGLTPSGWTRYCNTLCFPPTGNPGYNWLNWPKKVGGIHRPKQRQTITDCSIVFQVNKYVNLAYFLHICKHIMLFLCFSRVKSLQTALLKTDLLWAPGLLIECMCFYWTLLFASLQIIFKLISLVVKNYITHDAVQKIPPMRESQWTELRPLPWSTANESRLPTPSKYVNICMYINILQWT